MKGDRLVRHLKFRELDSGEVVRLPFDDEALAKPGSAELGPAAAE